MKNFLIAIALVSSLFLSGCTTLNSLISIAGVAAAGYGIYKSVDK